MALEQEQSACEEAAGCDRHKNDGVTVAGLGCGWGGCGVVLALGAALGAGGDRGEKERYRESEPGKWNVLRWAPVSGAGCRRCHWKKARRVKRKSQRMPIACQYQAALSTRI